MSGFGHSHGHWINDDHTPEIPTLGLALLVNPGRQMAGRSYPGIRTGDEIVQNNDFHNFTFDYSSIGEADPFYESDFSVDEDGWYAYGGAVVGNVDGIDGEDDVLKFTINTDSSYHRVAYSWSDSYDNQYYKYTGKVYIPSSNTDIAQLRIYNSNTSEGVTIITTTDAWVDFEVEVGLTSRDKIYIECQTSGGVRVFIGNGTDIFYVKDIKVQRVGLVAHWVFDDYYHAQEGTGKTALQDLTANGHNLTASAGFDWENQLDGDNPAYKGGNALRFDQVDDYFYIPAASANAFNCRDNSFSIFLIVYYNGNTSNVQSVYSKWYNVRFEITTNGTVYGQIYDGSTVYGITSISSLTVGWHLITFVRDVSGGNDVSKIYIDGILDRTVTNTTIIDINSSTRDLKIGNLSSYYFGSYITEIGYFNRALSATEVKALYAKAYGWDWDEVGDLLNDNFRQVISGGGTLTQDVTTLDNTLYKEQLVGEGINNVDYFGETTSHTVTLTDGTWTSASVKEVTNVDEISNFVEDFSKGGAEYGENIILNSDDWVDSDGDGLADNWSNLGANAIFSIVAGNGFVGNAQKIEAGVTENTILIQYVSNNIIDNLSSNWKIGKLSFYYRHNNGITPYLWFYDSSGSLIKTANLGYISDNPNTSARYKEIYFEVPTNAASIKTTFYVRESTGNAQAGDWIEVDQVRVQKVSNGNHGLAQGGLETGQPIHPYSWEFDGVDDYVDFGDVIDVANHSAIFPFWFKTSGSSECIVSKWDGSTGYSIEISSTGRIFVRVSNGTTTLTTVDDGQVLNDDNWHYGIVVIDRNANLLKRYYVDNDGNLINTGTNLDISSVASFTTTAKFFIGARNNATTDYYFGGYLGIEPPYLFDGQDGRPESLPANYESMYIKAIYNNTKRYYGD